MYVRGEVLLSPNNQVVCLEKDETIAIITLNRPERLNTFNVEMRDQLYEAILAIQADPSVGGAVLCGAGRGFCAGADLTEFGTEPSVIKKRRIRLQRDVWEAFRRLDKPIAAALHGFAVGSGLEMAMLCDFRFASPDTILALPEARLGMIPAAGGTQSLPRLVKQGLAMDFALGGHQISAEQGCKLRLINKLVPLEVLLKTTIDFMKQIVRNDLQTSRWVKLLVAHGMEMPLMQGLAWERVLVGRSWHR